MALLIDIGLPDWMTDEALSEELKPLLPDTTMYCGHPDTTMPDVIMLATSELPANTLSYLPNLALVQKLGAGVERILADPDLPAQVKVTRLVPMSQAQEIAEYCVAYILRAQRNIARHEAEATKHNWLPLPPKRTIHTTVGVLGLGHIGGHTAWLLASLGFRVIGWSRSPKDLQGVDCRAGMSALPELLNECDYVTSILPATPDTRDLFDTSLFASMKPGAVLINAGRGDLVVDEALIDALDNGTLGGAVLDTVRQEPLPNDHAFWRHPKITVTPHVSGWHVDGGLEDVAENYHRLRQGRSLLHQVDREAGY